MLCDFSSVIKSYLCQVALTHGPENVKPQVKKTDEIGKFCFEVPPGEYRLSAFLATPDTAPELMFSPPHVDVSVNSPLLGVKFYQAQVDVRGSVVCKETCGSSVSVMLLRKDGKSTGEMTISLTDQSSEFSFSNVLPGKYRIEVKRYSPATMSGDDIWCWEQSGIDVDVGADNVEGITFVQKGYWVSMTSSHGVDAYLNQPDGSRVDLKIKKGAQRICLKSPGMHELHFVDSCISFGNSFLRIDTSNPSPIYLKGEKYLLSGHINVDTNSIGGDENLPDHISMDMLDNEGTVLDGTTARLVSSGIDQSTAAIYKYSVWVNSGEKLIFIPRDMRNDGGKKILFYPRQQYVSVTQDGCQTPISPFSGQLGLYIEGSVSPPLSDVHIRVIAERESHSAPLKQGDLALETSTGTDGLFVAGPLYDDITYTVEASKPGYHVKPVGPHSFSCQKFSKISVQIYSREDMDGPFPSALLSLSGEDGYRNNSVTGVGGIFTFDNLFSGSFYIRPLLKDARSWTKLSSGRNMLSPPTQAIEPGSGESREIIFHATCVAYSAIGRVTLLSGQSVEGISVEARADSKAFYESLTDSSDSYRLRGLQPNTTYVIKVARKGELDRTQIERASPESVAVKVVHEDMKGIDFVVFEQPETTILSGHVEGKKIEELNTHIRVEIRLASDPSKIVSFFPLPLSNFFQVKDLSKSKHLLQLKSAIPSSAHKCESGVIEIDLERHPQVHFGPLSYRIEEDIDKQELTPAPVYPLVVGVSVIALFICIPRLKDLYQAAMGSISGSSSTAKKDVRKLVVRKKTY
ncbi:Nodal modulator 1 [Olea europaea subsp. europaea]|uniref:Nodal modulator 1 n=1 Tax=Olea europaea subsp. europaea TaxID=158383 RepID=A0A8S0QI21_OLEEU|nr:Nodal modulator 1 [Olea europaea subsp. europaea]